MEQRLIPLLNGHRETDDRIANDIIDVDDLVWDSKEIFWIAGRLRDSGQYSPGKPPQLLALLQGDRVPSTPNVRWKVAIKSYFVTFAWLAFYFVAFVSASAVTFFLVARHVYAYLPASTLGAISFGILMLIRLSTHLREHRGLISNSVREAA